VHTKGSSMTVNPLAVFAHRISWLAALPVVAPLPPSDLGPTEARAADAPVAWPPQVTSRSCQLHGHQHRPVFSRPGPRSLTRKRRDRIPARTRRRHDPPRRRRRRTGAVRSDRRLQRRRRANPVHQPCLRTRGDTLNPGVYRMRRTGHRPVDTQRPGQPAVPCSIFQVSSTLVTASFSSVVFINGASPCNVFWQSAPRRHSAPTRHSSAPSWPTCPSR